MSAEPLSPAPSHSRARQILDRVANRLGRGVVTAIPFGWMLLFFLLPLLIVFKISFADYRLGIPPYTDLVTWLKGGYLQIKLSFNNYQYMLQDPLYLDAYLTSIKIAGISTILTLLVGYPMAYGIARAPGTQRNLLLFLVILPFWTSFLIRVYAWMGILKNNGLLNGLLMSLGIIDQPLVILNTNIAVYIGIVYSYLPFMVLPLYSTLEKLDDSLLEAAHDLGARPWKAFLTVTLPLSLPGIIAGSLLVFIPAVGEFVIPDLLGGSDTLMIGRVLWQEFFNNHDWPTASAVALTMLVILVIPIMFFQKIQERNQEI